MSSVWKNSLAVADSMRATYIFCVNGTLDVPLCVCVCVLFAYNFWGFFFFSLIVFFLFPAYLAGHNCSRPDQCSCPCHCLYLQDRNSNTWASTHTAVCGVPSPRHELSVLPESFCQFEFPSWPYPLDPACSFSVRPCSGQLEERPAWVLQCVTLWEQDAVWRFLFRIAAHLFMVVFSRRSQPKVPLFENGSVPVLKCWVQLLNDFVRVMNLV